MRTVMKWIGGIFAVLIVIGIFVGDEDSGSSNSTNNNSSSPASISLVAKLRPQPQVKFVTIIQSGQDEIKSAENDMQKGGIKAKRDGKICKLLVSKRVTDWTGTVKEGSSNSDGKGVLSVTIANNIDVTTWNNAFSDLGADTLIEPGTSLFNSASNLKKKQEVKFSGQFLSVDEGCIGEQSMFLDSKIKKPDFTFRFLSISALE